MAGKTLMMVEGASGALDDVHKAFGKEVFTGDSAATLGGLRKLREDVQGARRAVEAAIRMDESQATTFWQEVGQFFEHGVGYLADKARFEAEAQELVANTRENLDNLERAVQPAIDVVDNDLEPLRSAIATWAQVADTSNKVANEVEPLGMVEGWSGQAADQYGSSASKQIETAGEFPSLPMGYRRLLDRVLSLNLAVAGDIQSQVTAVQTKASKCFAAAEGQFYVNTANANRALIESLKGLQTAYEQARMTQEALGVEFTEEGQSSIMVRTGWPGAVHGGGTGPSSMDPVTTVGGEDHDVDVEDGFGDADGVQR